MAKSFASTATNALALIAKNGRKFLIRRDVENFDEVLGISNNTSRIEGFVTAIVLPRYKGTQFSSMDDAMKTALVSGRMKSLLIAAKDAAITPQPLDVVTFDDLEWRILGVTVLSPNGLPIIYTVGVIQL